MESRYTPADLEQKWYKFWEENGYFKAVPDSDKPPFSILMPPPNLTGSLHLGHVMQHAIMDTVARYKRMQGFDVLLQPGVDHAGLQFQGTLDKKLSKEKINPKALSREEYLKHAWQFKDENADVIIRGQDNKEITIREISATQLVLTLEWTVTTTEGGRQGSLKGKHEFILNK